MPAMSKTYTEIIQQIEELKAEAERLKREEVGGVIDRIKEAIAHYGLTAADLGLARGGGRPGRKAKSAGGDAAPRAKPSGQVKYRDANGNVWGGRGPRPRWLREALQAGKTLRDFVA